MTEFVRQDKFASPMESVKRYFVESPFQFRRAGQIGIEICEHFENLAGCVDDFHPFQRLRCSGQTARKKLQRHRARQHLGTSRPVCARCTINQRELSGCFALTWSFDLLFPRNGSERVCLPCPCEEGSLPPRISRFLSRLICSILE